jgi:hypothetical protein
MSEYQRIAFRAIDGPVSPKNLEYMREQSSRAEITARAFDNEYNFGDFGGDEVEMLRRGYDLHLHYADFGIRKLLVRVPRGLPDAKAAKPYLGKDSPRFLKDKGGPAGTLWIEPFHEPGDLEGLWDFDDLLERLIPVRAEILDGDLRPLYLAHLAVACDNEHDPDTTREAPVPAGLQKLSEAQRALAELYGLSDSLISAAAQDAPPLPKPGDPGKQYAAWLAGQPQTAKDQWLAAWLADAHAPARRDILAEFQKSQTGPAWPTVNRGRTIAELRAAAASIQRESDQKAAAAAARKRAARLAAIASDPTPTLRETEELVTHRTTRAYEQIANLLDEVREALAGSKQADLAEKQALKLKWQNPTLNKLTAALRAKGLLAK